MSFHMANVKVIIPTIIIIIIAAVLITFNANEETSKDTVKEEWVKSGPFEIDKSEYNMGEKIFLNAIDLSPNNKGTIKFLRPTNDTHHQTYIKIPFDGNEKSKFNYYFEPRLNKYKGLCSVEDLTGNWLVKFVGTQYGDIEFEILAQPSSWDDRTFEPVC